MALSIALSLLVSANAAVESDRLTSFPGIAKLPGFAIYSGYLTIDDSTGKAIHYLFAESQNNPKTDPVLLWLNGGPGCSSVEGFLSENGPFVLEDWSYNITANAYSWNKLANLLYFESPAPVGYSRPGVPQDIEYDDDKTSHENLLAVKKFFELYPEFLPNEFYISGESYAGVYVPTLTHQIYKDNLAGGKVNLKGFAIGNPVVNWTTDCDNAFPDFAHSHSMVPTDLYEQWVKLGCDAFTDDRIKCQLLMGKMQEAYEGLNPYDVYRECIEYDHGSLEKFISKATSKKNLSPFRTVRQTVCDDGIYMTEYMNRKDVREAFHVDEVAWTQCTDNLDYTQNLEKGSIYLFNNGKDGLLGKGLKILIYSGDTDGVCPTSGTIKWINNLNRKVVRDWRSWKVEGTNLPSGYTVKYDEFSFLTIKGSGHMCIGWKRPQGFHMIKQFLEGKEF
jgi:carboxypeptidase C (cathepsin A)